MIIFKLLFKIIIQMINMNNNGLYNKMKKVKYQKLLRINIRFNKKYG